MGRSRYKIYEPTYPHFITCTILHWIPIFTRTETTNIIFDSLKFLQKEDNLKIYAYVILENHLHMIVSSDDVSKTIKKFKSFTAKEILKYLQIKNVKTILEQLAFYKKAHKTQTTYQLWQEGYQPKLIKDEKMMVETINYIHQNPVKRGYVDVAKHWRYSSARDYEDEKGLIDIERLF
ncbi:REP-associated tyrosine transposase [Arcobacter cloacae]|uniref:Transposase n=1 Tax=Arcobacter cloacae TaxID=1054034 RepID=A0A4Q0ZNX1_9BACT|nr:transposase [Arcobacter cloacae]RXJ85466.1 transposase [Arcobacter cloacae]